MTIGPDALRRLSTLLDEAFELADSEREAWLAGLQGDDAALGPTLRELLARHASAETADFLGRVRGLTGLSAPGIANADLIDGGAARALRGVAPEHHALAAGERIGPYRLLRALGSGGMGEVWLAERADGALKRQVALKLPTLGVRRAVLVERFARERDILASLEHPNIARLYDAGFADDGQPYLALEYVHGEPIDAWCRAHRPPVAERLRLLVQVADAVAFAHRRLVLHRDLKPGNILVTDQGQVRLLDFGIAKLIEGDAAETTELTRLGGQALTPRYASPEQLRGEPLTTASDVYSLGVVAYEVLSGRSPYDEALRTPSAIEHAIAEGALGPASARGDDAALRDQLRGDIDAILAHALRPQPAERYLSVEALAADIRHHLQGERVLARRDSLVSRARRFARRHRLPLALSGTALLAVAVALGLGATMVVTLALAVGLAVALWQARRAGEQARLARIEARTAGAVKGFLKDIFRASSGDQADPMAARRRTALELLDDGSRRIERELDDAPEAKLEVLHTLAEMYNDLGEHSRMIEMREVAVRTAERAFGPRSKALATALARQAMALANQGRRHLALPALQRAESLMALQRRPDPELRLALDIAWAEHYRFVRDAAGLPHAERAVELALAAPPSNDWLNALALLGVMQRLAGRLPESLRSFERAAELAPKVPGGATSVLAAVHQEAATTAQALGDAARCERHLRSTLELDERSTAPASSYVLMDLRQLALFCAGQGRDAEALAWFAEARRRVANAGQRDADPGTWRALAGHEAVVHRLLGDPQRALALTDEALALETDASEVPTASTLLRFIRCDVLLDLQRVDEAAACWREGRELCERFGLASIDWSLGDALREVRVLLARGDAGAAGARAAAALAQPGALEAPDRDVVVELVLARGEAALADGEVAAAALGAAQAIAAIETPPCPRMVVPLRRAADALAAHGSR